MVESNRNSANEPQEVNDPFAQSIVHTEHELSVIRNSIFAAPKLCREKSMRVQEAFETIFRDLTRMQGDLKQIKEKINAEKYCSEKNPEGIYSYESIEGLNKVLSLDLDAVRMQFENCQKRWDEESKLKDQAKNDYKQNLKVFMERQQSLMDEIFKGKSVFDANLKFRSGKLPLFGEQVSDDVIDFLWTAEESIKALHANEMVDLTAVRLGGKLGGGQIDAIQLVFSRGIESPVFRTEGKNEPVVQYDINQEAKISSIRIKVCRIHLHQVIFSSDSKELLSSPLFDREGRFVEQRVYPNQQIIVIYGVKDRHGRISSLGFIVNEKEPE